MLLSFAWLITKDRLDRYPVDERETTAIPGQIQETATFSYQPVNNSRFDLQSLKYFNEIAFQSEHTPVEPFIRKWRSDIVVRVEGTPTYEDRQSVTAMLNQLNQLQDQVTLKEDLFDANLIIRFQPEETFHDINQNYEPVNLGYFWLRWIDNEIYAGNILIDSKATTQSQRDALIKEELTQAMGLMNVSSTHADSVFNDDQGKLVDDLAEIDRELVRMLYSPEIKPSMSPDEALTILSQIARQPEEPDDS